ncbi:CNT family concentrative nucleoside transporter [Sphingomonas zeicaulis]|uniref:NupC/NupG family nucleoside CNT transporter n=1 Tax=Sphingomonas zeicaulis TaxID=1632740 RepID=UPI003D1952D0
MAEILRAGGGVALFLVAAWALAGFRRAFGWRLLASGLLAQILLAALLTRIPAVERGFRSLAGGVEALQVASATGAQFVFGYLAGGPSPFAITNPAASTFVFGLQALPAILLVGALSALLWHWGPLRLLVRGSSWLFTRLFGVSGPVGVSTSACIFLGMIEAPLLIRPLLPRLSRGELFILMVDGLSVIGGSMMIVLGLLMERRLPGAFGHILAATLISTPMAIAMARAIVPPEPAAAEDEAVALTSPYRSGLDAMVQGTLGAVKMAVNIAALLIAFIGTVALIDMILANLVVGGAPLATGRILGWVFTPVAWAMGFPAGDVPTAAQLLGTKVALNEVIAYGKLVAMPIDAVSAKGVLMLTYALGSFGNIGSVAILLGAMTAMAPERSADIVSLGLRALAAAFLTTCLSATIVGILHTLV